MPSVINANSRLSELSNGLGPSERLRRHGKSMPRTTDVALLSGGSRLTNEHVAGSSRLLSVQSPGELPHDPDELLPARRMSTGAAYPPADRQRADRLGLGRLVPMS